MLKRTELKRLATWHIVITFALIIFLSQTQASIYFSILRLESHLIIYRVSLALFALFCVLGMLFYRKHWKSGLAVPLFSILVAPTYIIAWMSQVSFANAGNPWGPLFPFKLYPMILAFIVPGSYLLNLVLMIAWVIEGIALWFYLDLSHHPEAVGNEPMLTILFLVIAFVMLYFKYRDEQIIRELSKKHVRNELQSNLARVFLSIRDQSNTPLQILKISNTLLKSKYPEEEMIEIQEKAIEQLIVLSKYMQSSNKRLAWSDQELMSDQEIIQWINALEDPNTEFKVL